MTSKLVISYKIRMKLAAKVPPVSENDICECFENRSRTPLRDTRERHDTDPPTLWFIAENYYGRRLKICFSDDGTNIHIKSAFVPNDAEERIYAAKSKELG